MSIRQFHIDMIRLGKLLPFAFNQTRRLQLSQYVLGSGHALAEHFGYLLNREDDINSPRLVRPPVELGQPRPVKQKGIGQLGGKGQAHVQQEPGEEEIGRQFGSYRHVVGHGITVIEDDRERKATLTPKQEESLLAFMEQDTVYRKYRDEVIILLGTGLRISEFCGLTTALDFKNRQINVDHQLLRDADIGYYIETPKTKNGIRQIPMSREVYQALKRVLKNRGNAAPFSVEGYKNFLFLKNDGMPKVSANYDSMLKGLVKKYNKQNKEQLPNITPHILRHTFCTRLANAGMNPKALQYIMGHANITMTLNYYAHATYDSAKAEMERLAA